MNQLLRRLAENRGLDPGPGSDLALEFRRLPDGGLALLLWSAVLGAVWLLWRLGRGDAERLGRLRGVLLSGLRILSLLVLVVILLDPQIVTRDRRTNPGRTVVFLDASQSMAAIDSYRGPEAEALVLGLEAAGVDGARTISRLEVARELLDARRLRALAARNGVDVFAFGRESASLLRLNEDSDRADFELPRIDPSRSATDPVRAVDSGLKTLGSTAGTIGQEEIAGLILISDGRRNEGAPLAMLGQKVEDLGIAQVVLVPVGDPSPERRLRIHRFDAPERVFPSDPFAVEVEVHSVGWTGRRTTVELLSKTPGSEEARRIASREVELGDAPSLVTFEDLRLTDGADVELELRLRPLDGEPLVESRHRASRLVRSLDTETRVLLVSGGPSHEYRALRSAWTRDDTVDVACWLQSARAGFPQDGDRSLTELPTGAALGDFDVFVLIDPDPTRLPSDFVDRLIQRVRDEQAGLWFVCGEVHTRRAFDEGSPLAPLEPLLPLSLDHLKADATIGLTDAAAEPRPYRATALAALRGPARLREGPAENAELWSRLPRPRFVYPADGARPGAEVLVETPSDEARSAQPVVATARVGGGRVLASASDETYRWIGVAPELHTAFWLRGLRLLIETRASDRSDQLVLVADRDELALGESIGFRVLGPTELPEDAEIEILAEDDSSVRIPIRSESVGDAPGAARRTGRYRPQRLGRFRARIVSPSPGEPAGDEQPVRFEVRSVDLEAPGPTRLDEFQRLAAREDTILVEDPRRLDEALAAIPSTERQETLRRGRSAWDGPTTLWILVGLLTIEWTLRKRWDLL